MFYINTKLQKTFGKNFKEGTVLFSEGEQGSTMYIVHRGKVKITKMVDGKPQVLGVLGEGQFFGEMAVLDNQARSATATTMSACELLEIPSAGFELLMQKSPELAMQLIHTFSHRLRDTNKMLNVLFYQDDYSRVILTLQNLVDQKVAEGNKMIRIEVDPTALAGRLNMTASRIEKVVKDMCAGEILKQDGVGLQVLAPRQLKLFLRYVHEKARTRKVAA